MAMLCPLTLAADCIGAGSCQDIRDETSLVQLKTVVQHGSEPEAVTLSRSLYAATGNMDLIDEPAELQDGIKKIHVKQHMVGDHLVAEVIVTLDDGREITKSVDVPNVAGKPPKHYKLHIIVHGTPTTISKEENEEEPKVEEAEDAGSDELTTQTNKVHLHIAQHIFKESDHLTLELKITASNDAGETFKTVKVPNNEDGSLPKVYYLTVHVKSHGQEKALKFEGTVTVSKDSKGKDALEHVCDGPASAKLCGGSVVNSECIVAGTPKTCVLDENQVVNAVKGCTCTGPAPKVGVCDADASGKSCAGKAVNSNCDVSGVTKKCVLSDSQVVNGVTGCTCTGLK